MHKDSIESLFTGANQIKLPSCHSTNQVASDLLSDAKSSEGTVIITDHQTAGKGQRGNSWESEPGKNLTLSVILKPKFLPVVKQFELTVVSSLAIVKTLEAVGLPEAQIKWPNDIYYGGAKIAGILIENTVRASRIDHSIVGVGLNVNQQYFLVEGATSVRNELGQACPLDRLLEEFLKHLNQHYSLLRSGDFQQLRTLYAQNLMWCNQQHTFKNLAEGKDFSGKIIEVNQEGKLIIQVDHNLITCDFKEISFVR